MTETFGEDSKLKLGWLYDPTTQPAICLPITQDLAAECSVLCAQPQKTCESARVCEVSLGQGEHSFHHPLSGMLQRGKN